jgi:hypothetical protein
MGILCGRLKCHPFHVSYKRKILKMSNSQIKQGFMTPDGSVFTTAAEARDYLRKPQVDAALKQVSGGNPDLAKFLGDNEDEIMASFEAGVIARVTKSQRNKLAKALEHLATIQDGKLKFIQDNKDAVLESFRWPAVKRMSDAEKAAETLAALTKLANANAAEWIVANRVAIELAYNAGVEKRVVNPKAMESLAKYRADRAVALAAAKAAKEAATPAA